MARALGSPGPAATHMSSWRWSRDALSRRTARRAARPSQLFHSGAFILHTIPAVYAANRPEWGWEGSCVGSCGQSGAGASRYRLRRQVQELLIVLACIHRLKLLTIRRDGGAVAAEIVPYGVPSPWQIRVAGVGRPAAPRHLPSKPLLQVRQGGLMGSGTCPEPIKRPLERRPPAVGAAKAQPRTTGALLHSNQDIKQHSKQAATADVYNRQGPLAVK